MLLEIHSEGTFTVLYTQDNRYEAHVRISSSTALRIGRGSTPKDAIETALNAAHSAYSV